MAEEEKPKQLVQPSTVIASGITAIVAALLTSRLGVAGTLIGTAMTPMLMTVGVAVLNAQIEKATDKISDLPSTVRGRLSTQRVRVPATPSPEEAPDEPAPPVANRRRDRRTPGVFERLLSLPAFLGEMSPSFRRRTLLTGLAAGLIAAVMGLGGVTAIEAASGSTFSCKMWDKCPVASTYEGETDEASTSLSNAFGGSGDTQNQDAPAGSGGAPAEDGQEEAQPAPGAEEGPVGGQYDGVQQGGGEDPSGQPQQGAPVEPAPQEDPAATEEPDAAPQDGSQEPPGSPGVEQPAAPLDQQSAAPSEQQQ